MLAKKMFDKYIGNDSALAQQVERQAVNLDVAGSSPAGRAYCGIASVGRSGKLLTCVIRGFDSLSRSYEVAQ